MSEVKAYSASSVDAIREAIMGEHGQDLMRLMFAMKLRRYHGGAPEAARALARDLGWTTGSQEKPRLTHAGEIAGDPIREYVFWVDRGRTVHLADRLRRFEARNFSGKSVLEVGCGSGCNLFSIADFAENAVGVDIEPRYLQFTKIFASLEEIEPPKIVLAPSEALPFPDASFDQVLILSSLQYMDIRATIAECARVLRPGGIFVTWQSTFLNHLIGTVLRRARPPFPRGLKSDIVTVAETLSYELLGSRLRRRWKHSTASPVYASFRFIRRQMELAGLHLDTSKTLALSGETVFQGVRLDR